jgi:hypothetical protein
VPPVPPIPNIRNVNVPLPPPPPNPLPSSGPAYAAKVLALVREAMQKALQESEAQTQGAEGGVVSNGLKQGVTIDLRGKNLRELPEEVVDVIKDELERLDCCLDECKFLPAPMLTSYLIQGRSIPQPAFILPYPTHRVHIASLLERPEQSVQRIPTAAM